MGKGSNRRRKHPKFINSSATRRDKCCDRSRSSSPEIEKAIPHYQAMIAIASPFSWHDQLFWAHFYLALSFLDQGEFESASTHTGQAESHAVNNTYYLGHALYMHAAIRYQQHRLEEAKSKSLHAVATYEELEVAGDLEISRGLLQKIEQAMEIQAASDNSEPNAHNIQSSSFV